MGFGRNHIWTNPARRIRQKPCMAKAHVRDPAETIFGPHAHAGSDGNNIRAACWIRQKPRMAKVQARDPAETTFSQHALPGSGRSHVWAKCTGKIRQKPHSAIIRTPDPAETTFGQHEHTESGRSHVWAERARAGSTSVNLGFRGQERRATPRRVARIVVQRTAEKNAKSPTERDKLSIINVD